MSDVRWKDDPRGCYIRLRSGSKFYLTDPTPDQFHVPDIAYHLARINRYTGASEISIAEHCVLAMRMAIVFYPTETLLPARMLIHDVSEFAYGDVSSPLKSLIPMYKFYEYKAELAVQKRFGVDFLHEPLVKELDDRMWLTESRMLFGDPVKEDYKGPLEPFPLIIPHWSPAQAEREWLIAVKECMPWVLP